MPQKYSLNVSNYSRNYGSICVYQTNPNIDDPRLLSLAWLVARAHPTTRVSFQWSIDYSFVWDETGHLAPGVIFDASQNLTADLTTSNSVDFINEKGVLTFANQRVSEHAGTLYVRSGNSVPFDYAAVGMGMSGAAVFVRSAQPNITYAFQPGQALWVTFGNYEQGEVLDVESITNAQQINFSPNVFSVDVTLNIDNVWTVK
ncbi:hypothetical protein EDF81_3357 [Enterobacter sp. BIGb0383]|uniref:protein rhiA n=1 Tax=unclassified Enterobacter TaxID=2608935 RepID=UPI000F475CF3|nr:MULTISPECIES: protein rhiA [unclassified Enterobacter]ROP58193.1 hypothetical protein EDF81_3357 [Enterobacter sp. BIGb0383]ROS06919.1 hypothetical protein EC848_3414 [Enterobacter sp. BIGb0359]